MSGGGEKKRRGEEEVHPRGQLKAGLFICSREVVVGKAGNKERRKDGGSAETTSLRTMGEIRPGGNYVTCTRFVLLQMEAKTIAGSNNSGETAS